MSCVINGCNTPGLSSFVLTGRHPPRLQACCPAQHSLPQLSHFNSSFIYTTAETNPPRRRIGANPLPLTEHGGKLHQQIKGTGHVKGPHQQHHQITTIKTGGNRSEGPSIYKHTYSFICANDKGDNAAPLNIH